MKKDFQIKTLFFRVFAVFCFFFISQSVYSQISGTVFRDYNSNGIKDDQHELGVKGISVTVTDAGGIVYGPVLTADDGTYTITGVPTGKEVRVEFSIPSVIGCYNEKVYSSFSGGSSIQFVNGGATNVNFAVNNPIDYAKPNPDIATTCFSNGDITLPKTTFQFGVQVGVADMDVFVKFKYDSAIPIPAGANSRNAGSPALTPNNTYLSVAEKMGSVWGVAYQKESNKLFTSAFMRRGTQFGPLGTGGIYVVNNANGTSFTVGDNRQFIDVKTIGINTGLDPHPIPPVSTASNAFDFLLCDASSMDEVGRIGIGDIDLSDDGKFMYLTNLNDRTLYKIKINNPATVPTAADVTAYPNAPWLTGNVCPNGVARPWATKFYRDKVYVGVVCTGENGGTKADLSAKIYELNAATDVWKSTPVLDQALNYTKGIATNFISTAEVTDFGKTWNPWKDSAIDPLDGKVNYLTVYPSPILSDIEFDTDGSILVGLMDRWGHQIGAGTRIPNADGSCVLDPGRNFGPYIQPSSGGDIFRVGQNSDCSYTIENNGIVSGITSLGSGNGQGIGGGEFYSGDNIAGVEGNHEETFVGGLALLPGKNQLLGGVYDPMGFISGGINFFDNTTGTAPTRYEVYPPQGNPFAGKGNGLGDVELLLSLAPIQIGNRIWIDKDRDGIQDAEEETLGGVTVNLYNATNTLVATTTTLADGTYAFDTLNTVGGELLPNTNYEIRVAKTAVPGYLSIADVNVGTNDAIDSDAILVGSDYVIAVTTGNFGENNHTYDIGFRPCVTPIINVSPKTQTICFGGTIKPFVANGDASTYAWYGPLADTTSALGTAIAGATTNSYTPSGAALPAVGATRYYAVVGANGGTSCSDTVFVKLTMSPKTSINSIVATPATCTDGVANKDAKITFTAPVGDRYNVVAGATYSGGVTYQNAVCLFGTAGSKTTLINPTAATQYTIRVFDGSDDCFVDTTVTLNPVVCTPPCEMPNCGTATVTKN
jgi:SdrD B-like domain